MLEKILKWGIYACALVPLIIFKDFFSPFHFGKVVVFRAVIEILGVLYLALILQDRRFLPKRDALFWAITAFVALYGVTSLTGINIYQSIMGTLERMGGWFTLAHFWLFYVMLVSVLRTKEEWLTLARISVVASLISTLYGFLQKTTLPDFFGIEIIGGGGRTRIFGTIGNTALFAGYSIVNAFLALCLFSQSKSGWRYAWLSIFILNGVAIFSTAVRGSLLAMVVALALFAVLVLWGGTPKKIKIGFAALILGLVIAEGILIANRDANFIKQSGYLSRITDVSTTSRTVQTRFWAWQAGIDGWNDSTKTILLGWGPENFNIPFSQHFNPKFFQGPGSETLFDRAHNMFVEILVTMGMIGFLAYISMFAVLFRMFWKVYRHPQESQEKLLSALFASGLVAYLIHNAFIFDTSANFVAFFIFAGLARYLFLGSRTSTVDKERRPIIKPLSGTLRYSAVILASIIAMAMIYKTDIRPSLANYASTRAVVASWSGDHPRAVAKFKQSLAYDTFPVYETRHRFAQYVLENYGKFKPEQGLNAGDLLLFTIQEVKKNTKHKLDYLPYLYISRAYIILGKSDPKSPYNDLALQNSMKALEISPTFVRTYYEVAQAYINKKDYINAVATFQKAAELNPEVGLTWWYLGATQLEGRMVQDGLTSIRTARERGYDFTANEGDLLRVINAYATLGNFTEVATLYEKLILMRPSNPQYRASLATAYAQIGKINEAVAEARIAAKLDPAFEQEAKGFVQSLGRAW